MGLIDNIINECDIALKTLSNTKPGTNREYPLLGHDTGLEQPPLQQDLLSSFELKDFFPL